MQNHLFASQSQKQRTESLDQSVLSWNYQNSLLWLLDRDPHGKHWLLSAVPPHCRSLRLRCFYGVTLWGLCLHGEDLYPLKAWIITAYSMRLSPSYLVFSFEHVPVFPSLFQNVGPRTKQSTMKWMGYDVQWDISLFHLLDFYFCGRHYYRVSFYANHITLLTHWICGQPTPLMVFLRCCSECIIFSPSRIVVCLALWIGMWTFEVIIKKNARTCNLVLKHKSQI